MKYIKIMMLLLSCSTLAHPKKDLNERYRQLEKNMSSFAIDAALFGFSNTFGETDEVIGIDLIAPFMHGSGIFLGFEKGLRNKTNSNQWGFSFGYAARVDKTKVSQLTFKWRAFGARFFRDRDFREFFSGLDIGVRYRLTKYLALTPLIRAEVIQRGSDNADPNSSTPDPGGNISASLGLTFYL